MKVVIKNFSVETEIKNQGIEFQANDNNGEFKGGIYITRTGRIWCKDKKKRENGAPVDWDQFIEWTEGE